ncbi:MAG: maltose ABC transporter substrate-binding protein [Defluviitaleaceae bacterium]|nr:maltose ABC transporter substrate-binding protein [Defluviitaleaceae bacterium]
MKKFKSISSIALGLSMMLAFGACGDGGGSGSTAQTPATTPPPATGGDTTTPPPATVADQVTLTVWESVGGPDEWIRQAGAAFTALHPHIAIEFVHVELGDTVSQIMLDGPAGVGPDLFAAPHDRLGDLIYAGHISPVNASYMTNILDGSLMAVSHAGNVWGFPVSAETYGLFYNRDLIATPPATFEELIEFSQEFNAANPGQYGFVMDPSTAYYTILFTSSEGNMLFGPDGTDTTNTRLNTPESVAGMAFMNRIRQEILPISSGDLDTGMVDGIFASGNAAMHITGPWNFSPFTDAGINFGVTTLPSLPGNTTPAMSFSGTRVMFVSAYTRQQEEASLFGQFLISYEMQRLRYDITGALPTTGMELGGEFGELATGLLGQMAFAYPMPSIPEMGRFWEVMGAASSNIWDGDGTNVQSELDAANAAIIGG